MRVVGANEELERSDYRWTTVTVRLKNGSEFKIFVNIGCPVQFSFRCS